MLSMANIYILEIPPEILNYIEKFFIIGICTILTCVEYYGI